MKAVVIVFLALFGTHCIGDEETGQQHGWKCDSSLPCLGGFSCIEGQCACPYPGHQSYDYTSRLCISNYHGPCLETVNGVVQEFPCKGNSVCDNSTGIFQCSCKSGMVESRTGACLATYGGFCRGSGKCDGESRLTCVNGKCSCPPFHEWVEDARMCMGLVGAICNTNMYSGGSKCAFNSFCQVGHGGIAGMCACRSGDQVMSDRKCKRP